MKVGYRKFNIFFAVWVVLLIVMCTGCGHTNLCNYKLKRLVHQVFEDQRIIVKGSIVSSQDLQALFGATFDSKKMIALQICINNTSADSYIFSPKLLNTKAVPLQSVARSLHKNILARVIPLGIVSCIFWPFTIPTTILGMRALHHNELVDKQLEDLGIDPFDSFIVEPYSTLNRIIFIKNKHKPDNLIVQLEEIATTRMHQFSVALS